MSVENPMEEVFQALLNHEATFPPTYLYHFSDMRREDLDALLNIWPQVNLARKRALLEDMETLAEADFQLFFDELAERLLTDPDSVVRMLAIRLLWQNDNVRLIPSFLQILQEDEDYFTRAAAATALGRFVYAGEVEEISPDWLRKVEDALLQVYHTDRQKLVRRRALESLSYSSRPEVPGLIEEAVQTDNPEWLASALFAMGRSANRRWIARVMEFLDHYDPSVRMEAVRAAGELAIKKSRATLLKMLPEEVDDDVRDAILWALSQIGGQGVRAALEEALAGSEEDEDTAFLEDALDNLNFTEGTLEFGMFDFDLGEDRLHVMSPDGDEDDDEADPWDDEWLAQDLLDEDGDADLDNDDNA